MSYVYSYLCKAFVVYTSELIFWLISYACVLYIHRRPVLSWCSIYIYIVCYKIIISSTITFLQGRREPVRAPDFDRDPAAMGPTFYWRAGLEFSEGPLDRPGDGVPLFSSDPHFCPSHSCQLTTIGLSLWTRSLVANLARTVLVRKVQPGLAFVEQQILNGMSVDNDQNFVWRWENVTALFCETKASSRCSCLSVWECSEMHWKPREG